MQAPWKLKLLFEDEPDLDLPAFQKSLSASFKVKKEPDGIYLHVAEQVKTDAQILYLVNRDLDRHFFLTCVRINAAIVRKRQVARHVIRYRIHGELPKNIVPQKWTSELAIQLKLWFAAVDSDDLLAKVILFYQIIEISNPKSPPYTDPTVAPHPLTECRLVRNLVAHAGDVKDKALKLYCAHLGFPEHMLDPTDPHYIGVIARKVPLLENQAKAIISKSIR